MSQTNQTLSPDVRREVREHYGKLAADFQAKETSSRLGTAGVGEIYEAPDVADLPEDVTGISLGSGDPVTLAAIQPGETVLDLGSGGGIDCFLAAQRVGESGHVIGVDMTAEMVDLARKNQEKVGAKNVEFRLGEIEHLPVADNSVDVAMSNCVIVLSPDREQVFREAYRVLKPGGVLAVSEYLVEAPWPEAFVNFMDAHGTQVGRVPVEEEYLAAIEAAGFVDVTLERIYPDHTAIDEELIQAGFEQDVIDEIKQGKKLVAKSEEGINLIAIADLNLDAPPPRMYSGKVKARKPMN